MASSPSDDKRAEFAKLFDLFEMLATRRSRVTATQSILDDTRTIPVPAELEPVFRSLATVVPPRSGRPRRNTVAAFGRTTYPDTDSDASDSDSDVDIESVAKFPLGKTYSFTFKMMIHKLYQVDEWAQKVRDVLKRSQIEYKPLAEQAPVRKGEAVHPFADGRVHFKGEVRVGSNKSIPLAEGRPRSHSAASKAAASTSVRSQGSAVPTGTLHAVKKRCIGRRKSLCGVFSPTAPVGEGWIYDAAVSSAEVRERVPIETTADFAAAPHPRPRYQSLQTGTRRMGSGPRRIVSAITTASVDAKTVTAAPRASTKRRLSQD
ncbi:hypothetical protein B0H11DRAFT_515705 [Mycena galericulata]|nr:hypothetical protein B0H11DRAFT_515705 [Mycena galericulata]